MVFGALSYATSVLDLLQWRQHSVPRSTATVCLDPNLNSNVYQSTNCLEINLNGNIVANKGFIRQMASPGTTIIAGKYVSAWGGIQSTGQAIGQILLQYVTEGYGRKPALLVIWFILTAVCFIDVFPCRTLFCASTNACF